MDKLRPDLAVMSCDADSGYREYWPVVSRMWQRIGIEPVLSIVGEDLVIPEGFQASTCAQWARIWTAAQKGSNCCIISDIDMMPISRSYFTRNYSPDKVTHLNPQPNDIPVCYIVGTGDVLKSVFHQDKSWEECLKQLPKTDFTHTTEFDKTHTSWNCDEAYLTQCYRENPDHFEMIPRLQGIRIDRSDWQWRKPFLRETYLDAHLPRPYKQYEASILQLEKDWVDLHDRS